MFLIRVGDEQTGSYSLSRARRVGRVVTQSNGTVKGKAMNDDDAIVAAAKQFKELEGTNATKLENLSSSEMTIVAVFR